MHLESARLVYEQITKQHAQELKSCLCDPKVYENVDDGIAPTFDELLQSFASRERGSPEQRRDETWVNYAVRIKEYQVVIGRVEATVIESRAEVAYILGVSYWRQGYGSESLTWLQRFLRQHYRVEEFWATVTPGNEASKRLLLKNNYVEVSDEKLPRLTSYDSGDWVFFRSAKESFDGR